MIARCVYNSNCNLLKLNQIYEIKNSYLSTGYVDVFIDDYWEHRYYESRFEEITELRVGDIIQIDTQLNMSNDYEIDIVEEMEEFKGKYVTITRIINTGEYKIEEDDENFYWTKDMFELFTKRRNIKVKKKKIIEINIFELFNT